jgi:YVTN family beta-propeller protein
VSNRRSYTVDVIQLAGWKVVKEIPVGAYPRGIVVSPDPGRRRSGWEDGDAFFHC